MAKIIVKIPKKQPWKMAEDNIYKTKRWVFNPKLIDYAICLSHEIKKPDPYYIFRGIVSGLDELYSLISGGKSGSFWSNYIDSAYVNAGLLIAEMDLHQNKIMEEAFTGKLMLSDMCAIYINKWFIDEENSTIIRILPKMTFSEFIKYYPKATEDIFNKFFYTPKVKELMEIVNNKYDELRS